MKTQQIGGGVRDLLLEINKTEMNVQDEPRTILSPNLGNVRIDAGAKSYWQKETIQTPQVP